MGDVGHDKVGTLNDVLDYPAVCRKSCTVTADAGGNVTVCVICTRIGDNA